MEGGLTEVTTPKISVVMAVFNGAKFINESVDSILCQTFEDFEFIIIDDGSTDETVALVRKYQDERIIIYQNEQNVGLTKSLNLGLRLARGRFIARQDADDISLGQRFERQIEFLSKNSDVAFSILVRKIASIKRRLGKPVSASVLAFCF